MNPDPAHAQLERRSLGPHDIGGAEHFGRVPVEKDQPTYEDWQMHVLALLFGAAVNGLFGFGDFRAAIEKMHPLSYLSASYYERLIYSVETNLVANGVLTADEIEAWIRSISEDPDAPLPAGSNEELAEILRTILPQGMADLRAAHDPERPPLFAVGQRVRGKHIDGDGYVRAHARHPGYVQDKEGVVERSYGIFPTFPPYDLPSGDATEHVYAVRFDAADLWPTGESHTNVVIDLSESYLEPVQ
jgi:nitrile hydratase beta subunit